MGLFSTFLFEGAAAITKKREAKQSGRAGGRITSSLRLFNRMANSPFGA
jgi:hypothetical protein